MSVIGKIKKGFTLVELLVVILIVGVLAGLLLLAVRPIDNKVKKEACNHNRAVIIRALETYRLTEGKSKNDYSLQEFIDDEYKDTMSTKNAKCPSGGIYTARSDDAGKEFVFCSVHSVTSGGGETPGGTGNYFPGTQSFGNPGILPNSTWPTPVYDPNDPTVVTNKVTFPKGSSFSYVKNSATEYYVVINDSGIQFGRNKDAVTIDYAWGIGEMIKVSTKPVVTWSAVVAENLSVSLGEVVYDDTASPGKYYISGQFGPINKWTQIGTGNWVEIK